MCGENTSPQRCNVFDQGSSPRVRGKLDLVAVQDRLDGLIPACAGKTTHLELVADSKRAHPRVCGENFALNALHKLDRGSSPRVRGKQPIACRMSLIAGLIPACAGKTGARSPATFPSPAHPRVCGENCDTFPLAQVFAGSSPRVRGKLPNSTENVFNRGLIPACAGKTTASCSSFCTWEAHPRVCGENTLARQSAVTNRGSSPRVRGKHLIRHPAPQRVRLIPACAGKTNHAAS